MTWNEPTLYILGMFGVIFVGALLPTHIESREDHIVITIASGVAGGILGPKALILVWGAVVLAAPLILVWHLLVRRRPERPVRAALVSMTWPFLSAFAVTVGFVIANLAYAGWLGREYPVSLATTEDFGVAGLIVSLSWLGMITVRMVTLRVLTGSLPLHALDPFDNVLLPYLLPLMGGFPLVAAAVALYRPSDPYPSLFILWWCFPLYAATAFDLHRRRLAQELRRDVFARQRLAAIGEVSARIVHQSRHQVGLMGWSIHRLRGLVGQSDPAQVAAAQQELDALAQAKDRLSEMLASELLHESPGTGGDGEEPGADDEPATSLAEMIREVGEQLRAEADREDVTLLVDLAAGVGVGLVARPWRDVVFNLLDNAIDAAETRVQVHLEAVDGGERIRICDDGPGLAGTDPSRMFEPFFTTKSDGTGMGLAIADALVGDMGGDLRYERGEGVTTFVVDLPAATPPENLR